jgi:hypothetical protein
MAEPKIFASLTPRLLARKGGAKPAMRPQVQPLNDFNADHHAHSQDDLGWNDMGEDSESPGEAEVVAIHGASTSRRAERPQVVASQQDLAERLERRPRTTLGLGGRRAAFTLRIDSDRHLQLRLASTVSCRSAQALLTEALDRMLEEMPEIRDLADNVRKRS